MARSNGSPRRATLIASTLVVGVIVVAGAILTGRALISDDEDRGSTAPPTSADSSSTCDLPDGDLEPLTEAPEDVDWELVNSYALPSGAAGPAEESGGVHYCYARSGEGAVLAAASFSVDLATPGINFSELAERRITGPAADQYAALDDYPQEQKDSLATPGISQIAAFRIESISEDHAVVSIVHRFNQGELVGTYGASVLDLRWIDGDWRWNATEGSGIVAVPNLSGYIPWSGA